MATLQEILKYWFYCVATKPGVIENKSCNGTDCLKAALSSGITNLQVMVASARSVSRGSMKQ
jgi:hypothetical protein